MAIRRDRRRGGADVLDTRRGGVGVGTPGVVPTTKELDLWLRVNGVDVANSNAMQAMSDLTERETVTCTHVVQLEAGDYFEVMFAVNDLNMILNTLTADAVGPATPSITLIVSEVRCQ